MFGGDGRSDFPRVGDDTPDRGDRSISVVLVVQRLDDRLVYLDIMGMDEHDLLEIALILPVIIDGNLESESLEFLHLFYILRLIERYRFQYLEADAIYGDSGSEAERSECHHDPIIVPILFMDIDRDMHIGIPFHIENYLAEHGDGEIRKPPLVGCYIHEVIGTDYLLFSFFTGVLDPCKRFKFSDMGIIWIMDVLVVWNELRRGIAGIQGCDEYICVATYLLWYLFIPLFKDIEVFFPYVLRFGKGYMCIFDMFLLRSYHDPRMELHIVPVLYMEIGQKGIHKIIHGAFHIFFQDFCHIGDLALFIYETEGCFVIPIDRSASTYRQVCRRSLHYLYPIVFPSLCGNYIVITGHIDKDNGPFLSGYILVEPVLIR